MSKDSQPDPKEIREKKANGQILAYKMENKRYICGRGLGDYSVSTTSGSLKIGIVK